MRPARPTRRPASPTRLPRAGRAAPRRGFTLVEMLVSVTLVLMMMLMFAEIYGLAQATISTQKGIAENDQKARILTQVLRRDFDTRTFRSVYPFKLEPSPAFAGVSDETSQLIALRKGYFSISENDDANDTDDVLQLTIQVDQPGYGGSGDRVYGKASFWPSPPSPPKEASQDNPEYDDGIASNGAAMSGAAEVSYFLRGGNLFRSVLLIREPYVSTTADGQPPIDPAWLSSNTDPRLDYDTFSSEVGPDGLPPTGPKRTVWNDFDFSAYRWPLTPLPSPYQFRFHRAESLSNDPAGGDLPSAYRTVGGGQLRVPESLGAPYLRFGHMFTDKGEPLEFSGAQFIGRFTTPERSSVKTAASNDTFAFPGSGWAPFDGGPVGNFAGTARRGVDLMLSNVHAFDVEVWDDVVGAYVDLGHELTGTNPYTGNPDEPGFYHEDRRRIPLAKSPLVLGENYFYDHPSYTDYFANNYDTWHPRMFVADDLIGTQRWRNGRAPYRPQRTNPDPNTAAFNDPTSIDLNREPNMAFGDDRLDDDNDGTIGSPLDSDAEAPLRAVRITVRYLDSHSGQMRQATIEASLID